MAKSIMIQGTTSNAGKSLLVAGLCRIFSQDGYKVAPFKAQNMALNSYITDDGLEMGRAQVVQAEAAYKKPDIKMNPILLKPTSDKGSQVILNGEVYGNFDAYDYYKKKKIFVEKIKEAYNSLSNENDIIVIEGAGSPAEINLKENDIVNMGMAKLAKSPVIIVGDIDRGGVFAALYGTYMLQSEDEKSYIKGNIINKFRGDVNILEPGIKMFEEYIPVPTIGVVPYIDIKIDDEDSLSSVFSNIVDRNELDIVVIRLPRISNFTDFNAFEIVLENKVRYVSNIDQLKNPDLIIIPGTKNTIGDLKWLKETGLESKILKFVAKGIPVFGICGGFQMLCKTIKDPYNLESGGEINGLSLIDAYVVFEEKKIRTRVKGTFKNIEGIFSNLKNKNFEGYEIHMGITYSSKDEKNMSNLNTVDNKIKNDGLFCENVYGSYVHGIFDSREVLEVIAKALYNKKGLSYKRNKTFNIKEFKEIEYNKLADVMRNSIDLEKIYKIMNNGI